MTRWFCILILLSGCASVRKIYRLDRPPNLLFPHGSYTHRVTIKPKKSKKHSFTGIIKLTEEKVIIVGLTAFQSTLFHLKEDRKSGKVTTEVFYDGFNKAKPHLEKFYGVLKYLFDYRPTDKGNVIQPAEITVNIDEHTVGISLSEYDLHGIPGKMEMNHPNFQVTVYVAGYEI